MPGHRGDDAEAASRAVAEHELRAALAAAHRRSGRTYEQLAEATGYSRSTVGNYLTKPGHGRRRDVLEVLLGELRVDEQVRGDVLRLFDGTRSAAVEPAAAGWRAAARTAGCTVWEMAEFTPREATVHTAIGRRHPVAGPGPSPDPPAYVERAHDPLLRADIAAAAAGRLRALILLRGASSTGKTRSLFEAVQALCPGWAVVRPRSSAALTALPSSDLLDRRRCVLWLNELNGFLEPDGTGLSVDVLRDLFDPGRKLVVVGTLWPEKLWDSTRPGGRDDRSGVNQELLVADNQWVRAHDIPMTLTTRAERAAAAELAVHDDRLRAALDDRDRVGFTQTLAGAYELLHHYRTGTVMLRLLLDAAADARRLGLTHALTRPLLRELTLAAWREAWGPRQPAPGSFDSALSEAVQPLRGTDGVRALIPLDLDGCQPAATQLRAAGYTLADYLEHRLGRERCLRPVGDATWTALVEHTADPTDLHYLAKAARNRGRYLHAESLYRKAAAVGALAAPSSLASFLFWRPGREADAERAFRVAAQGAVTNNVMSRCLRYALVLLPRPGGPCAGRRTAEDDPTVRRAEEVFRIVVASGNPVAWGEYANWLSCFEGRRAETEQAFRDAVDAGSTDATLELARWLGYQWSRRSDAERVYRDAVETGGPDVLVEFAQWLRKFPDRRADAECAYRDAAHAGRIDAALELAIWLLREAGCEKAAEQALREAKEMVAGNPDALCKFAHELRDVPGYEADVERAYRAAARLGHTFAPRGLAEWLRTVPGREADAEQAYRECDDGVARRELARWLGALPGREADAEQAYRDAALGADGDERRFMLLQFADWLSTRPGCEVAAEKAYRDAAADSPHALRRLGDWLSTLPDRAADADRAYRDAEQAYRAQPVGQVELADRLRSMPGREAEAEQAFRNAAAAGDTAALYELGQWLNAIGRDSDAERAFRDAIDAGVADALDDLWYLLRRQPGRVSEAEQLASWGIGASSARV